MFKKNDHVVCIDESLPAKAPDGILKLGRVYKILDIQIFPNMDTIILKIQDINTNKIDWHHGKKFSILKREA